MTDLSPEIRAWIDAAGDEVIRYMRSGQMKVITIRQAVAIKRGKEIRAANMARRLVGQSKPIDELQLSEHERQVIAGVELGLSDTTMAANLKITPPRVKRIRERLKRVGFL